jgi:hypothetical protein
MRQKLGVALAVFALALSGAREAADQFGQFKSLAGAWATTNAWNSLLVYAAGTFDGLAPRKAAPTVLVAANSATRGSAKVTRRVVRTVTRRQTQARVEVAGPQLEVATLTINPAEADTRRSDVDEFEVGARREAGAFAGSHGRKFGAADFETQIARAGIEAELARLGAAEFVLKFARVEARKGRGPVRRPTPQRKVEEARDEEPAGEPDGGDAQEVLFETPSSSGLLNCDEEPRR